MRNILSRNDIRETCGSTYFERGRRYFEQGRVKKLEVVEEDEERVLIRARVNGSGGHQYRQNVEIEWLGGEPSLYGECSCQVGFDCKHVAAVSLAYCDGLAQRNGTADDPEDIMLHSWLRQLANAGRQRSTRASGSP